MIDIYADRLKEIDKNMRKLEKERETVIKEMNESGYFLNADGIIGKNEKTFGIFWDISYCAYYVGEKGMYTTEAKGAREITNEHVKELKTLFEEKKYDEAQEILLKYLPVEEWVLYPIKKGIVTESSGLWKWTTLEKGYHDGEMNPGTNFYIKETSLKEITDFENYYEEDVAP